MSYDLPYEERLALAELLRSNTKHLFMNPQGQMVDKDNMLMDTLLKFGWKFQTPVENGLEHWSGKRIDNYEMDLNDLSDHLVYYLWERMVVPIRKKRQRAAMEAQLTRTQNRLDAVRRARSRSR